MTTPEAAAAELVANIEPLLKCQIATAVHHGLDEVRISLPRAKEIHRMALILEKRLQNILAKETAATTAINQHLDRIFKIN
jgi:hypothetical protein